MQIQKRRGGELYIHIKLEKDKRAKAAVAAAKRKGGGGERGVMKGGKQKWKNCFTPKDQIF